jgi:hypothetical protein
MDSLHEQTSILSFDEHTEDWLNFVVACRRGEDMRVDYCNPLSIC